MIPQVTVYRCNILTARTHIDPEIVAMNSNLLDTEKCSWGWPGNINSVCVNNVTPEFHAGMMIILGEVTEYPVIALGAIPEELKPVMHDILDEEGNVIRQEAGYEISSLFVQIQ